MRVCGVGSEGMTLVKVCGGVCRYVNVPLRVKM